MPMIAVVPDAITQSTAVASSMAGGPGLASSTSALRERGHAARVQPTMPGNSRPAFRTDAEQHGFADGSSDRRAPTSGKEALEVGPPDAGKGRVWTLRRARCDRRILAARRRGASSKVFKRSSQIPSRSGGRRALLVTVVRERSDRILMHAKLRDGD